MSKKAYVCMVLTIFIVSPCLATAYDRYKICVRFSDGIPASFCRLVLTYDLDRCGHFGSVYPQPVPVILDGDVTHKLIIADENGVVQVDCPNIRKLRVYPAIEVGGFRDKVYGVDVPAIELTSARTMHIGILPECTRYVEILNDKEYRYNEVSIGIHDDSSLDGMKTAIVVYDWTPATIRKSMRVALPYRGTGWETGTRRHGGGLEKTSIKYFWEMEIYAAEKEDIAQNSGKVGVWKLWGDLHPEAQRIVLDLTKIPQTLGTIDLK